MKDELIQNVLSNEEIAALLKWIGKRDINRIKASRSQLGIAKVLYKCIKPLSALYADSGDVGFKESQGVFHKKGIKDVLAKQFGDQCEGYTLALIVLLRELIPGVQAGRALVWKGKIPHSHVCAIAMLDGQKYMIDTSPAYNIFSKDKSKWHKHFFEPDEAYSYHLLMGRRAFFTTDGKSEECIMHYNACLEIISGKKEKIYALENFFLWANKGAVYANRGNNEAALKCFDRALKYNRKGVDVMYTKGLLLLNMGQKKNAVKSFTKILNIHNTNSHEEVGTWYSMAWYGLAQVHAANGEKKEMIDCLNSAFYTNSQLMNEARTDSAFRRYWKDSDFVRDTDISQLPIA